MLRTSLSHSPANDDCICNLSHCQHISAISSPPSEGKCDGNYRKLCLLGKRVDFDLKNNNKKNILHQNASRKILLKQQNLPYLKAI